MLGLRRFVAPVALATVALMLGGCFKIDQKLTVLADGSGKLVLLFGAKDMKEFGAEVQAEVPDGSPDELDSSFRGYVAATKPKEWTKDGWKFIEFTVYFDDINEFKMIDASDDALGDDFDVELASDPVPTIVAAFRFDKSGDGHRLIVTNNVTKQIGDADEHGGMDIEDAPEESRAMMEAMLARMLEGFGISENYTMPGNVTSIEGLQKKDGRTASLALTGDDVKTSAKREKVAKATARTVICGPSTMSADEIKAFKDELATAKAEWAKMRAAAKRSDK